MGAVEQGFQQVLISVPAGIVENGMELVVGTRQDGDLVMGKVHGRDGIVWLFLQRPKKLKPNWNPPKLKKGWLTWDESCAWYWWEKRPEYHAVDSWTYPEGRCVFESEEIGSMMAKILGCPDCTGFDERNCIWEVGNG